ncbi:MAG: flagellar motor switch phosphatase FliY [Mahellales bacterium]
MDDILSQQEIDALLRGESSREDEDKDKETLTSEEIDAIGEIGNISMGTAATALYSLINNKVAITTPKVEVTTKTQLGNEYPIPYVAIEIQYTQGLQGTNLLIMKEEDVKLITDLMMGGDGSNIDGQLNEMHISAIGEAMNQMVGSAATSLASIFNKNISISPPKAFVINLSSDKPHDIFKSDEPIVKVSFRLFVESYLDSEIMQLLPIDFARDLVETLMEKTGEYDDAQDTEGIHRDAVDNTPYKASKDSGIGHTDRYSQSGSSKSDNEQREGVNRVKVQPIEFQSFEDNGVAEGKRNIELIMDVPLEVTVELGRTKRLIKDILELGPGSVIELDKLAGEPVDILINGKLIAKGEVVVIDDNFGVRITDILSPIKRLEKIK